VLLVEDEMIVSMLIEDMLADLGCTVVGPAFNLGDGMRLARSAQVDCAVLDVNLGGERVFPLADLLQEKGARIIYATGYGRAGLRAQDQARPVLQKPFRESELERTLAAVVASSG
jgi:CheY-like chemotaxis protein